MTTPKEQLQRTKKRLLTLAADTITRPGYDPTDEFDQDLLDLARVAGNTRKDIKNAVTQKDR